MENGILGQWLRSLLQRRPGQTQGGGDSFGFSPGGGGLAAFFGGGQMAPGGNAQMGQYNNGNVGGPGVDLSRWQGGQMAPGGNAQVGAYMPSPQQQSRPGQYTGGPGASGFTPPPGFGLGSFTGGGGQMAPGGNAVTGTAYRR